jgi:hypothetical protein
MVGGQQEEHGGRREENAGDGALPWDGWQVGRCCWRVS